MYNVIGGRQETEIKKDTELSSVLNSNEVLSSIFFPQAGITCIITRYKCWGICQNSTTHCKLCNVIDCGPQCAVKNKVISPQARIRQTSLPNETRPGFINEVAFGYDHHVLLSFVCDKFHTATTELRRPHLPHPQDVTVGSIVRRKSAVTSVVV